MKMKISKIAAIFMAALIALCSFSAFATNSEGSKAEDIAVLDESTYTVAGKDTTQNKQSEYTQIPYTDETVTSTCDVYATVAEGEKVYDPENPGADENGFVDGSILIGVPTVLIMNGTPDSNGYYIAEGQGRVKGNIAGTTVISVVPEETSNVNGADVNKNVTPSFNDNAVFHITAKTNQATAGSWHGSFTYTISTFTAQ